MSVLNLDYFRTKFSKMVRNQTKQREKSTANYFQYSAVRQSRN